VLKNFFVVKSRLFCLCFVICCCFGMVFLALFEGVSAWLRMLVCVKFHVGKREVWAC